MKRREFISGSILTLGAGVLDSWSTRAAASVPSDPTQVKRVLVVFKCHLDIGFTETQQKVIQQYFTQYFPQAVATASWMRQSGSDRYVWTTGSWLLYEYLEQANAQERKKMEQAISAGDIAWHALPFNWQTEMLDRSMIEGCLGLSASLDRRFGLKTVGAKMTDVPGHSRGIIRPLAAAGVKLLDIGVNPASTPPNVPEAFVWRDPDGGSLAMLYHHHAYGGRIQITGTDLAVAVEVRVDNTGPHSQDEIKKIYAELRQQFPSASITASNMSSVAVAVDAIRDKLPIVTQEIGDTWIYGVPSDPIKVSRYREVSRLRQSWIDQKRFAIGDGVDCALLGKLALAPEHTWGTDTKRFVDYDHYNPDDLAKVIDQPGYKTMERSWKEKRDDIDSAVATLPPSLQQEAHARLKGLQAVVPRHDGLTAVGAGEMIDARHLSLALDPKTGAITTLRLKKNGREWAAASNPLALFVYQTLSAEDYEKFLSTYVVSHEWWAPRDFGKPEISRFGAEARERSPSLVNCWSGRMGQSTRVVAELKITPGQTEQQGRAAWPISTYLCLDLPDAEAAIDITFVSIGKAPNRMPESMWLTFAPVIADVHGWTIDKVDQRVSPLDVIKGGARGMHAVTNYIRYEDSHGYLELTTVDAPVVALGKRSPLNFSLELPDMKQGIHINLFNNAWGTNYPQWAGGDWMYRFKITLA